MLLDEGTVPLGLWWITARATEKQREGKRKLENKGEVLIPTDSNLSANEWFGDFSCWFWPLRSSENIL